MMGIDFFARPGTLGCCRASYFCEPAVNDDAQLIHQTLAGHSAAFGQLVLKYQDRLYNTVFHVVGNAEDAKDVVQDAFVQAFLEGGYVAVRQRRFTPGSTGLPSTWPPATIAGGGPPCRWNKLRLAGGGEPVDGGDGPTDRLEQAERCRQVRQAIRELNEECQAVLVLREIDGCCYETIAAILDLPLGTVRSRLHRARRQLREQLKEVLTIGK